jgi:hypothetical protein
MGRHGWDGMDGLWFSLGVFSILRSVRGEEVTAAVRRNRTSIVRRRTFRFDTPGFRQSLCM